jgi:hypothetical protein
MKMTYSFDITIEAEESFIELHGEAWPEAFQESAREFAEQLRDFIQKHPFIQGCTMTEHQ